VRLGQDRHLDAPYKYGPIIARRTLVLILIKPAKPKLDDHYQMLPQIRQNDVSKGGPHDDSTDRRPENDRPIYRG
jgi:hypothetical protein